MIILIFLITMVGAGYSINFLKDVQYSIQVALAKEKIELELIDEAEQYLLTAKKYKPLDSDAQELYDYVKNSEKSIRAYNTGEKYFENKDYLKAAESYDRVNVLDVTRYDLAMKNKKESIDKYFEENATKEFNQLEQEKKYREAKTLVKRLLKLTTDNQEELNEKLNYYNQKIEEDKQKVAEQERIESEKIAAKEEAERKAKEEGFYILTFKTGSAFSFEYKPF